MMSSAMPALSPPPLRRVSRDYPERALSWQCNLGLLSLARPLRRTFLDESLDAFLSSRLESAPRHHPAGKVVGRPETEVDLPVERLLALCDDACAARSDDAGEMLDRRIELGGGHHAIDQAPGEGREGVYGLAGEQQLHGALACDIAADADRRSGAEHAHVDARQGELRAVGSHREIAHGNELAPCRGRNPVDPSDYRLRQPGQRKHQRVTGAEELLLPGEIGMRAKLLEIVSRTEPAAFGGQDHRPNGSVSSDPIELSL